MTIPISFLLLAICIIFPSLVASTRTLQDSELVVEELHRELNASRRELGYFSCGTGNPIDDCWRCGPKGANNRQRLADCAVGFGRGAIGGRGGKIYVVTDPGDDDAVNPKPGTLRDAVIRDEPLWIVFKSDMVIKLKEELIMNSFKTIDGRGASVTVTGTGCITVQDVTNIILHGIHVTGCKPGGNALVRSSPRHYGLRGVSDGDAISISGSKHVWVDHCTLSSCADGLVDAVLGSTAITVSNNHFSHHDEVMLFGANDYEFQDKDMKVTVAFNHFGEGLTQRMPRCRFGYFEVINNYYSNGWGIYAIGGSAGPTIISQGNIFVAPNDRYKKEVTFHEDKDPRVWKHYTWSTKNDLMVNGAFFTPSGGNPTAMSMSAQPPNLVKKITANAGALG